MSCLEVKISATKRSFFIFGIYIIICWAIFYSRLLNRLMKLVYACYTTEYIFCSWVRVNLKLFICINKTCAPTSVIFRGTDSCLSSPAAAFYSSKQKENCSWNNKNIFKIAPGWWIDTGQTTKSQWELGTVATTKGPITIFWQSLI